MSYEYIHHKGFNMEEPGLGLGLGILCMGSCDDNPSA